MRKFMITAMLFFISMNAHAVDSAMGVFGASTDVECKTAYCGRQDETSSMLALSMEGRHFGGDVLFTNNAGGFAGYFKHNLGGLHLQAGLMLLPDVAYGGAAGFPEVKASDTVFAPFVGLKYKYFAVRYTQFAAEHSYSSTRQIGTDPVTGLPVTETGTAETDVDKSAVWAGLVFNF